MANNRNHGGRRKGAGAKPSALTQHVKNLFSAEMDSAIESIIEISRNPEHQHQLRALEIILNRSIGQPLSTKERAIHDYLSGEITAMTAALIIEASGGSINQFFRKYVNREIKEIGGLSFSSEELPDVQFKSATEESTNDE